MGTIDGINAAAGSGDIRLQAQVAGDAPGGERAHGEILRAGVGGDHGLIQEELARVVGAARLGLYTGGVLLDPLALFLGDGDGGLSIVVIAQIHMEAAGFVVVHHQSLGAVIVGFVGLIGEGNLAPAYKDNLSGYINALVVGGRTGSIQQHIVVLRTGLVLGGIQGQQLVAIVAGLDVGKHPAADLEHMSHCTIVVHRGHRQGGGIAAGGAAGVKAHVIHIGKTGGVPRALCPGATVTHGNGHYGIALGHRFQNVAIAARIDGHPGIGRAQRQVDRITAQ